MSHAITIPRLHTIACPNTSFRATDGNGGSTRGYQALSTGWKRSKALMVGKRSEPSVEDILETIESRARNAEETATNVLQQAKSASERARALEERARIAEQRSRNALERATALEEQVANLRCKVNAFREEMEPVNRFFRGVHIEKFIHFCVEIFIYGTEEDRRRGPCYASYEDWVNAQTTSVVTILTSERDVFGLGPRALEVPIDALRAMQQVVPPEDNLWTNVVDKSCVLDIAISIQKMAEGNRDWILSKSQLYLLFEVCFGIPVDDCVDSKSPVWTNTKVPLNCAWSRGGQVEIGSLPGAGSELGQGEVSTELG